MNRSCFLLRLRRLVHLRTCEKLLAIAYMQGGIITSAAIASPATFQPLQVFANGGAQVYGISADGSTVYGGGSRRTPFGFDFEAARWNLDGTIEGLGDLPGGRHTSETGRPLNMNGISADGSVLVGRSEGSNGFEPFRWTSSTGIVGLGLPTGTVGAGASGVSVDGEIVVGNATVELEDNEFGEVPFRWTKELGTVILGSLPSKRGDYRSATGMSSDGATVVGVDCANDVRGTYLCDGFRWTATNGVKHLNNLLEGSSQYSVSADGSVVVGLAATGEAVRWTEATGWVGLGFGDYSDLRISADGRALAASSGIRGTKNYWSEETGAIELGTLSGADNIFVNGMSDDGSVVVGYVHNATKPDQAFYWTKETGMVALRDLLISQGITELDDWQLNAAWGVSANGRTIAGNDGASPSPFKPWVVTLAARSLPGDFNGDGLLTALDIDQLTHKIRSGAAATEFDLNHDGHVDEVDRSYWVHQLARTHLGDANLDSQFNSQDLILVFQSGQYENLLSNDATWATGDWNGDLNFDSGDLVAAFQDGVYEQGPAAVVVPEPSTLPLLVVGAWFAVCGRQKARIRNCHHCGGVR